MKYTKKGTLGHCSGPADKAKRRLTRRALPGLRLPYDARIFQTDISNLNK